MDKNTENIKITEDNLLFIGKELSQINKPLSLYELAKKLAYQKTSKQLSQEVKKYDPYCKYEAGDLIYKEYNEPLTVSSKGVELFKGTVVLNVVDKIDYKDFNCEMLEVDYSGGGTFRKYIDYMKKTKTQVLLPSNLEGKAKTPKKMGKEEDPRLGELPMTDRDFKKLEKNLRTALSKSNIFFNWDDNWQLSEKRMEIKEEKITEIENYLQKTKSSASTTDLVNKIINMKNSDDLFELCCMSLNSILDKNVKKDFVYVSPLSWGKWHLKKILNSFPDNLPISAPKAKLPVFKEEERGEITQKRDFPLKIYLTWREILSGGIKIPKSLYKEFSCSREFIFTDIEEGKDYMVYYYPSSGFLLGLEDFYESNNVAQGASLTLEKKGLAHFSFWLKKSKKKLSVLKINYDPKNDTFAESGKEVFTFSLPNKIIYLERETLTKLFSLYKERDDLDLKELLVLIFKYFGLESNNQSLHYLRAYHLVNILKQTTEEDVVKTLLNSPEFSQPEKEKGVFLYQEKPEEVKPEEHVEIPHEEIPEEKVEEAPIEAPEEILPPEIKEERREEVSAEAPFEPLKVEIEKKEILEKPAPPKREKVKRKRLKMEGERGLRAKKGVKKFIEEKIELEESELEALTALKAKEKKKPEEEKEERRSVEKKEEFKFYVSEEPSFGIFAEKLKSALDKKKKKK